MDGRSEKKEYEELDANQLFEELSETYTIFVTEHDIFKAGLGSYPIERMILPLNTQFNDRAHILYVNGTYRGEDPLGELMHDFCCSNPNDMKNKMLADRSRYFKEDPKGVEIMCKTMEDMRNEVEQRTKLNLTVETIKKIMHKLQYTAQQAMDFLDIPTEEQPKYLAKL